MSKHSVRFFGGPLDRQVRAISTDDLEAFKRDGMRVPVLADRPTAISSSPERIQIEHVVYTPHVVKVSGLSFWMMEEGVDDAGALQTFALFLARAWMAFDREVPR